MEINSTSHTRSYSPAHELTTVDGDSQTFDADGNLTDHHSGIELTWDDANRLVGTDVSSTDTMGIEGENEYGYDFSGKRTWKKVIRSSTVVEHTVYVYAGDNHGMWLDGAENESRAYPKSEPFFFSFELAVLRHIEHTNERKISGPSTLSGSWNSPDDLWVRMERLLPKYNGNDKAERPCVDLRRIVNCIFYVLTTGCQWKAVPHEFGSGSTLHRYFQQWTEAAVFRQLWKASLHKHVQLKTIQWN